MKRQIHQGTCDCGKLKFASVPDAREYDRSGKMRIYLCKVSDTYHLTNKSKWDTHKPPKAIGAFNIRRLQRELNDEVTLREIVIKYMDDQYKKMKQVEFSTSEIRKWVEKNHPAYSKDAVAGAVSELKKQGTITELDKLAPKIPGAPGRAAKLFTLTRILEEETKPKQEVVKPVTKTETPVAEKPVPVPTNPFDKVNSQLGELLSKVNGIANGYAVIAEAMSRGIPVAGATKHDDILNLLAAVSKTIHTVHTDKLNEILEATQEPIIVSDKVADDVNARLQDLNKDNSFIYRVREEMDDRLYKTEQLMTGLIKTMPTPTNFGSLTDEEKYQRGIKDGIKLAVEMGLILPDA